MKNITLLKAKVGILAVSCLSITTLFACVDKDARSDLSPNCQQIKRKMGILVIKGEVRIRA